jgi:hypothetical protein
MVSREVYGGAKRAKHRAEGEARNTPTPKGARPNSKKNTTNCIVTSPFFIYNSP